MTEKGGIFTQKQFSIKSIFYIVKTQKIYYLTIEEL